MLLQYIRPLRLARTFASMSASAPSASATPIEDAMRSKLIAAFNPHTLAIYNDSHKHAHHQAMKGVTSKETHFRVVISSEKFEGLRQLQRHREINKVLDHELKTEGMIHALQIRALSIEEEKKLEERAKELEAAEGKGTV